jgi:hypothetical protein
MRMAARVFSYVIELEIAEWVNNRPIARDANHGERVARTEGDDLEIPTRLIEVFAALAAAAATAANPLSKDNLFNWVETYLQREALDR